MTVKVQPIRQPVIAPVPETTRVFGEDLPICHETFFMACAERLGLAGFGKDGFGPGADFRRPEDFYLKMVANVAAGEKPGEDVPEASDAELTLFLAARGHLPATVFDARKWEAAVGARWWRKVVYVLNRGGRFQEHRHAFKGELLANQYGQLVSLYSEKVARTRQAMTGNYWLQALLPENAVLVHATDGRRLGLRDGDRVKVTSASNPEGVWPVADGRTVPMVGRVRMIEGIRPGVVAFSLGHGHWAYGAGGLVIDRQAVKADPRRARGLHANAAMRVDPVLKNTCPADPAGASAVFYDTKVKLVKVA